MANVDDRNLSTGAKLSGYDQDEKGFQKVPGRFE
jgi:hypothetical protein